MKHILCIINQDGIFQFWQEKQFYCAGTLIEPQIDQRKLLKWWIWLHWQYQIDLRTKRIYYDYVSLVEYKTSLYYYMCLAIGKNLVGTI